VVASERLATKEEEAHANSTMMLNGKTAVEEG
jgi:hypothetical protein